MPQLGRQSFQRDLEIGAPHLPDSLDNSQTVEVGKNMFCNQGVRRNFGALQRDQFVAEIGKCGVTRSDDFVSAKSYQRVARDFIGVFRVLEKGSGNGRSEGFRVTRILAKYREKPLERPLLRRELLCLWYAQFHSAQCHSASPFALTIWLLAAKVNVQLQ